MDHHALAIENLVGSISEVSIDQRTETVPRSTVKDPCLAAFVARSCMISVKPWAAFELRKTSGLSTKAGVPKLSNAVAKMSVSERHALRSQ